MWGQVLADMFAVTVADHHDLELAAHELEKLGAGLINGLLRGFVPAPGNGAAVGLQAGSGRPGNDTIDIPCFYQAAQGRYLIKLVALGDETGGARLDNFSDLFWLLWTDLTSPPRVSLP